MSALTTQLTANVSAYSGMHAHTCARTYAHTGGGGEPGTGQGGRRSWAEQEPEMEQCGRELRGTNGSQQQYWSGRSPRMYQGRSWR